MRSKKQIQWIEKPASHAAKSRGRSLRKRTHVDVDPAIISEIIQHRKNNAEIPEISAYADLIKYVQHDLTPGALLALKSGVNLWQVMDTYRYPLYVPIYKALNNNVSDQFLQHDTLCTFIMTESIKVKSTKQVVRGTYDSVIFEHKVDVVMIDGSLYYTSVAHFDKFSEEE